MLTPKDYVHLYNITKDITPLKTDCGQLCGSICCRTDEKNSLGIYLFPGEECMFNGDEEWIQWEICDRDEQFFPPSWPQKLYFIKCTSFCQREKRPLACRFFPLTPHFNNQNNFCLIYETLDLPYSCPLISKKIPLQEEFIKTVAGCWEIMLKDYRLEDIVREDSLEREIEYSQNIEIVWQG